jgi:hypothetical protein
MQTPEIFLANLNRSLRELQGASRILEDERVSAELMPVMRSLLIAEVVGENWTMAVGGSQGAGKTNLICTMYGLSGDDAEWLKPNEGQGEKLPILIQEDSAHRRPQGYLRLLRPCQDAQDYVELAEVKVSAEDFAQACRGSRADVQLPVLKVPRKYFHHDKQSIFLLPGYEPVHRENKGWQALMRQVLIGAASCVIVTDQTRLANKEQMDIVRDMLSNELRANRPVVVVSKTEGLANDPQRLSEVRKSAAEIFKITEEFAESQVICTGSDDPEYVEKWLPKLRAALHDISIGGGETRQMQLARLESTLDQDLSRAINLIHSRATLWSAESGESELSRSTVSACLEAFDDAVSVLRDKYRAEVDGMLGSHYGKAWEVMQQRLIGKHEGIKNRFVSYFDTVTETQQRLEADVESAWKDPGSVLPQYARVLEQLTNELRVKTSSNGAALLKDASGSDPVLRRLGYVEQDGRVNQSKFTNPEVQSNLAVLLGSGKQSLVESDRSTPELEKTARLLPVMALEFARIASMAPEIVGVCPDTLAQMPKSDLVESMQKVQQQFEQFGDVSKSLLKGVAVMMAIDIGTDGEIDTIPALLNAIGMGGGAQAAAGAAGAGALVASSVVGVVAIGFLAHSAMQEVRRHDGEVRSLAHAMTLNTKDRHYAHFMTHFDELMGTLRRNVVQGLRLRYSMDQRLMERDRLAKALADVHVLRRDLLDDLARSGQTQSAFGQALAA